MSARVRRGLSPPAGDLGSLPAEVISGAQLWRIHRATIDPLRPASGPHGRFNLAPPRATLYTGAAPLAAFVEVFGRLALIDQRELAGYRLTELRTDEIRIADLTSRKMLGRAGLTAEIHSTVDYALTIAWAEALSAAGFGGIRYRARHDPAVRLDSVAIFSADDDAPASVVSTSAIPADLIEAGETEFGLLTAPRRLRRR